jgi:hypothetical protein
MSRCRETKYFGRINIKITIPDISATISRPGHTLNRLFNLLDDTEVLAGHTPTSLGESAVWATIVNAAEENGVSYCNGLLGEPLFTALYGTYAVTLDELKDLLKASTLAGQQTTQEDGFQQYGGRRGSPQTKPPELQRKRQFRTKRRPP